MNRFSCALHFESRWPTALETFVEEMIRVLGSHLLELLGDECASKSSLGIAMFSGTSTCKLVAPRTVAPYGAACTAKPGPGLPVFPRKRMMRVMSAAENSVSGPEQK